MDTYTFMLILDHAPSDEQLDALFEAGCDDGSFGLSNGVPFADFDREASTLGEAVLSAIADVESVPGMRVVRVEPDDLVTATEIADRLGRTRESIRLLAGGQRGDGSFPSPVSHARDRNRLWRWTDVLAWAGQEPADAHLVAATNAALQLREQAGHLATDQRDALRKLAVH